MSKKLEDYLEEYFANGDHADLCLNLKDMMPKLPEGRSQSLGSDLFQLALPKACDARTDGPREKVGAMLAPLAKSKLLLPEEVTSYFKDSLEFLEDEICDVPHIAKYQSGFIAHAVAAGLVTLADIADALGPLVEAELVKADAAVAGCKGAAYMLVQILRDMKAIDGCGEAGAKAAFEAAKLDVATLMPPGGAERARRGRSAGGGRRLLRRAAARRPAQEGRRRRREGPHREAAAGPRGAPQIRPARAGGRGRRPATADATRSDGSTRTAGPRSPATTRSSSAP